MIRKAPGAVSWVRLVAEGLAIVASILIAFAIDAWWQGRLEKAEAHQILVSLQAEFKIHRSTLIERESRLTERENSIVRLLRLMQSGDFPGPAVMDTLVHDLTNPGTWDPGLVRS